MSSRASPDRNVASLLLSVGFLALAAGVWIAHLNPARGYELDIYWRTPVGFWIGTGIGLACALAVALRWPDRDAAYLLGGGTFLSIVALPILRGYEYYGAADSLTHLGWTRDLAASQLGPFGLFYPGLHTAAVFLADLGGVAVTRSLLLVVLLMVVSFVVFLPMLAWRLTRDRTTTAIVLFSAFMLLPINTISTHLDVHPMSMAILFSPALLYVAARYMNGGDGGIAGTDGVTDSVTFGLIAVGTVLYHPQLAFTVLLVLVSIAAVQVFARRSRSLGAVADTRPLHAHAGFLAVAFGVWTLGRPRFRSSAGNFVENLLAFVGGAQPVAAEVGQRGASLAALGAGLPEIFAKLFLVSTIYALLAGLLVLWTLRDDLPGASPELRAFVICTAAGLVPVGLLTAVYLLANVGTQAFRYAGFVMVLVTLLGAIALGRVARNARLPGLPSGLSMPTVALVLAVTLWLSLAVVFPSTFIYKSTNHVTEQQLEGYERAFERMPEDALFRSIRGGPERYAEATFGTDTRGERYGAINATEFRRGVGSSFPDSGWYLVLNDADRATEVRAYRQLRYSRGSFVETRRSTSTSRVMTNGGVDVYLVTE